MKRLLWCVPCMSVLLAVAFATGSPAQQQRQWRFEGSWWMTVSTAERVGFVSGFADCYIFGRLGPARFEWGGAPYTASLSTFIDLDPARLREPLYLLIPTFDQTLPPNPVDSAAEEWNNPHGFYDGLWWLQTYAPSGGGRPTRLGYIEGYLTCNANLAHGQEGTFSRPASEYLRLVERWYDVNPKTADIRSDSKPVADVLVSFRDRGSKH